jgi:hypothetical protein
MSEAAAPSIQFRTEHSRSLEDAERFKALDTLTELGVLVRLDEVESFHGRVREPGETGQWRVDPTFQNGSNDSGNRNVNARPTLYTSDEQVASEFSAIRQKEKVYPEFMQTYINDVLGYAPAEKGEWLGRLRAEDAARVERARQHSAEPAKIRPAVFTEKYLESEHAIRAEAERLRSSEDPDVREARWQQLAQDYQLEIHEILSTDPDARLINFEFNHEKLSAEDKQRYSQALRALALPLTAGSPVAFEHRTQAADFWKAIEPLGGKTLEQSDIDALVKQYSLPADLALQMGSAYNSAKYTTLGPGYLASLLLHSRHGIVYGTPRIAGVATTVPFNLDYFERYLRSAHIVGVRQPVSSSTLGRGVTSITLFDLEKVGTARSIQNAREVTSKHLGKLAGALDGLADPEAARPELIRLLTDAYAKPRDLVAAAMQVEGYKAIYEADAGNWEGFSLAEHSETVLNNFEENFADKLPVELLAPMRLALLAHDLGKPAAVANGDKANEQAYNLRQAADFFNKLGVDPKTAKFLSNLIGPGLDLAYQYFVRGGGADVAKQLKRLAKESWGLLGEKPEELTNDQLLGFVGLCRVMLVCDGGAYTSMAVTRDPTTGIVHRNAPSFNRSFVQPVGLGSRGLQLAVDGEAGADMYLTPREGERQSRVKIISPGAARQAPTT